MDEMEVSEGKTVYFPLRQDSESNVVAPPLHPRIIYTSPTKVRLFFSCLFYIVVQKREGEKSPIETPRKPIRKIIPHPKTVQ